MSMKIVEYNNRFFTGNESGGILETKDALTIREMICLVYAWANSPNSVAKKIFTAAQMAKKIDAKLASVASQMLKMCKQGTLERTSGVGPRGGYGYTLKIEKKQKTIAQSMRDGEIDRIVIAREE
jgi:predicted transcriptional regulator